MTPEQTLRSRLDTVFCLFLVSAIASTLLALLLSVYMAGSEISFELNPRIDLSQPFETLSCNVFLLLFVYMIVPLSVRERKVRLMIYSFFLGYLKLAHQALNSLFIQKAPLDD